MGLVDGNGHIYTSTTLLDANEDGNAIHSAVSLDGTNIWHVGEGNATGGKYTIQGSMISTQVEQFSRFNSRFFSIYNKTLYYSANHALGGATITNVTANPIGTTNLPALLPTSFVQSNFFYLAGVLGNSITNSPAIGSPWAFAMFNLNGGTAPDTLYVADNVTNAPGEPLGKAGGVLKFCYIPASNAWVNFGYIYAEGATGITGTKNGTNITLYITEGGTIAGAAVNVLYPYKDFSGFAANPASNPWGPDANLNFEPLGPPSVADATKVNTRGIALAPQGGDSGTISAGPGVISVGPPSGLYFRGPQGGPFPPSNFVYSVANLGGATTNFTVSFPGPGFNWLTATPASGTLASGASTTVTIAPNVNANSKAGGFTYSGLVGFFTGNSGQPGVVKISASLVVDAFFILPSSNYLAVGSVGGAFSPSSYTYTLTNVTSGALPWTAFTSASWNTLSITNGTLAAHTATNITVAITPAANSLARGTYQDTLVITNVNANAPLEPRGITLQVGFGFFDDFSTYANGDIVGQNNWVNPTSGLDDNPYQIVNGVLVTPGGFAACNTSSDQEPAKAIASTAVTDTTQFAYLGMSITVTSAPVNPNTWDFTFLPVLPTTDVTHNEARTSSSDMGGGHYKWNTHVNGFDSLVSGNVGRTYGTQYNVLIVGDIVNSNCWVFVNPTNSSTSSLFAMTPDAHDGPDVPGWGGPGNIGVGGIDIDNFCSANNAQPGYLITKMALSTNYADVYNFLTAVVPPPGDPFATWQTNYFTAGELAHPNFSGPNADPFGKGMSNTNQFLAGFNPTNASAYVHITSINKTNSTDVRVDYLGASGNTSYAGGPSSRTNVLEFTAGSGGNYNSNNFVSTGQTNILSGGVGLGTLGNMVEPGGATNMPARYYRVRVLVP